MGHQAKSHGDAPQGNMGRGAETRQCQVSGWSWANGVSDVHTVHQRSHTDQASCGSLYVQGSFLSIAEEPHPLDPM